MHPQWTAELEALATSIVRRRRIRGADADDLLQVIRIKFIKKAGSVPPSGHAAWVRVVTSNACIDYRRRVKFETREVDDDDATTVYTPGIVDALQNLPDEAVLEFLPAILWASGESMVTISRWMGMRKADAMAWVEDSLPRLREAILAVNPALIVMTSEDFST